MKLRNKKTGEIRELPDGFFCGDNLKKICEEWEDYEEPKEYWYIDYDGGILCGESDNSSAEKMMISMGNHFETIVDAEMAVEKLKAWKRLKDKKFEFTEWYKPDGCEPFIVVETNIDYDDVDNKELQKDLDLLFGGEE